MVLRAKGLYGVRYLCIQLDSLGSLQVSERVFLCEKGVALIRGLQTNQITSIFMRMDGAILTPGLGSDK